MIQGCYINVDSTNAYTLGVFSHPEDTIATEISRMVGGPIEVAPSANTVRIFVNENGKNINLPVNHMATMVWSVFDTYGCILGGDYLVGNVVILGPTTPDGRITSAPANAMDLIQALTGGVGYNATVD